MSSCRATNEKCGAEFEKGCRGSHGRRCPACYRKQAREAGRLRREINSEQCRQNAQKWYRKNRERVNATARKWQEAHPERHRENQRRWYEANRERHRKNERRGYETNREQRLEDARQWYQEHREQHNADGRRWHKEHPAEVKTRCCRRRARLAGAGGEGLTAGQWRGKVEQQEHRCAYCNRHESECGKLTVEHVVPIVRGGKHDVDNIVAACHRCNMQKHTKTGDEYRMWMNLLGSEQ